MSTLFFYYNSALTLLTSADFQLTLADIKKPE